MTFNIVYQNVRGLRTKTNIFFGNVLNNDFDIVCLSETWLVPGIFSAELFDPRYNVYRSDRDYNTLGMTLGGGTLIAVDRRLAVNVLSTHQLPSLPGADVTNVNVCLSHINTIKLLHIFCCYFPHGPNQIKSQLDFFEYLSELILDCPNDDFLILGDFNISNANWVRDDVDGNLLKLQNPSIDRLTENLFIFMNLTGINQYNCILNKND